MKLLLLVHSESDVAHLGAAAKAITNSAITGIWAVFSPAITVNSSEAAAKLDTEITGIKTAMEAAAARMDYKAAEDYYQKLNGKMLDRGKALRDAWKTAPEEARKAKTQAIFSPFVEPLKAAGLDVRVTGHSDHYEREQWVAMLNSLSGVWFKPFTPGSFIVGWPESVKDALPARDMVPGRESARLQEKLEQAQAAQKPVQKTPIPRAEELASMKHFSLVSVAKKLGIETEGKVKSTLIEEIVKAEFAVEPALAEY